MQTTHVKPSETLGKTLIINNKNITRGLIIDTPWISYILDGTKDWEMRSTATKIRGDIALIQKGTGTIVGVANLKDSLPSLGATDIMKHAKRHRVDYIANPELLKWCHPWVLEDVQSVEPIPYTHKQGAVIWVSL